MSEIVDEIGLETHNGREEKWLLVKQVATNSYIYGYGEAENKKRKAKSTRIKINEKQKFSFILYGAVCVSNHISVIYNRVKWPMQNKFQYNRLLIESNLKEMYIYCVESRYNERI